jgi:hypothetical protein
MVPRVICNHDPRIYSITYQGKRRQKSLQQTFQKDQEVDVMDTNGVWWKGSMVACKDNLIQYHYHGWETRWDKWYPTNSLHVAPVYSITKDWISSLRIGEVVDVKKYRYWFRGILCILTSTTATVNIMGEIECIELSSERLMFSGAHTYTFETYKSTGNYILNAVWKDPVGNDIFKYKIRNGTTFLTDHLLSELEIDQLFPKK